MKYSLPVIVECHEFTPADFVGGDPAIDFVNTVTGRDAAPRDYLDSYSRLVEWAGLAELLPKKTLRALENKAASAPKAAATALTRAKQLREAMFLVLSGIASGGEPAQAELALLRKHWLAGTEAHRLVIDDGRLVIELRQDMSDLDLIASIVAYRLLRRLSQVPADRLRICQGPNCAWLFIDSSKAGRRRWCDMAVCGNSAKSRRFHARARSS